MTEHDDEFDIFMREIVRSSGDISCQREGLFQLFAKECPQFVKEVTLPFIFIFYFYFLFFIFFILFLFFIFFYFSHFYYSNYIFIVVIFLLLFVVILLF